MKAKSNGFSDVLYLDSVEGKYVEEVSSCNIFTVKVIILQFYKRSVNFSRHGRNF